MTLKRIATLFLGFTFLSVGLHLASADWPVAAMQASHRRPKLISPIDSWTKQTTNSTAHFGTASGDVIFDGTNIWASSALTGEVKKLRPRDGAVLGIFPVGHLPHGLAFDGTNVWVANTDSDTVLK